MVKLEENISEVLGMIFIFNGIRFAISISPEHAEEKIALMGKGNRPEERLVICHGVLRLA